MFESAFNSMDRVMRNDEGLASELIYAEQTSWLLFLKYLDDMESLHRDSGASLSVAVAAAGRALPAVVA